MLVSVLRTPVEPASQLRLGLLGRVAPLSGGIEREVSPAGSESPRPSDTGRRASSASASGSSRSTATISLLPSYSTRALGPGRHVVLGRDDQHRVAGAAVVHRAVQLPPRPSFVESWLSFASKTIFGRGGPAAAPISTTVSPFFPRGLPATVADVMGDVAARPRRSRRVSAWTRSSKSRPFAVPRLARASSSSFAPSRSLSAVSSRRQGLDPLAVLGCALAEAAPRPATLRRRTALLEVGERIAPSWARTAWRAGSADAPSP